MRQEDYRSCMATGLKDKKGLSKEERQKLFCVQSRICSGKASTEEEAERLCSLPKPPQPPKEPKQRKSKKCIIDANFLANCIFGQLDKGTTVDKLAEIINQCGAPKRKGGKVRMAELPSEVMEAISGLGGK